MCLDQKCEFCVHIIYIAFADIQNPCFLSKQPISDHKIVHFIVSKLGLKKGGKNYSLRPICWLLEPACIQALLM